MICFSGKITKKRRLVIDKEIIKNKIILKRVMNNMVIMIGKNNTILKIKSQQTTTNKKNNKQNNKLNQLLRMKQLIQTKFNHIIILTMTMMTIFINRKIITEITIFASDMVYSIFISLFLFLHLHNTYYIMNKISHNLYTNFQVDSTINDNLT